MKPKRAILPTLMSLLLVLTASGCQVPFGAVFGSLLETTTTGEPLTLGDFFSP